MEITGYKRGSQLHFERDGKNIVFDFKDLSFYRPVKNGLRKLNAGQEFFRKVSARDVAAGFMDKSYAELIRVVDRAEYRLKNFASIFEQLAKYQHLESYILLDIKFTNYMSFKNPANQFPKQVIEFMKESRIEFGSGWEAWFQKFPDLVTNLCTHVRKNHYLDLEVYRMLYGLCGGGYGANIEIFKKLSDPQIKEAQRDTGYQWNRRQNQIAETPYGCEYKTLFDYLVMIDRTEALSFSSALTHYRDYLKMMRDMERNKQISKMLVTNPTLDPLTVGYVGFGRIEKYPKFLRTRHDIVQKNYSVWENEVDEKTFYDMVKRGFEYKWGKYQIVVPKTSADVRNEGTALHHCVASYVSRIMDGTTQIVFLREESDESLVTVEIRANAIVQARGYANRNIDDAEEKWLKTFARAKNLNYKDVKRDETMPTPPVYALQKWNVHNATLIELSQLVNG